MTKKDIIKKALKYLAMLKQGNQSEHNHKVMI